MKVVILCGGKGTRMREVTEDMPKPMAAVGGYPLLWHIMKLYSSFGYNDFVLLLGYKGEKIKEYFMDYEWKNFNFILDGIKKKIHPLEEAEKWKITFVDTGQETQTGSRILSARKYIGDEPFMLTYGDGLSDININKLVEFHMQKGTIATVTGIEKTSQFGIINVEDNLATYFGEKISTGSIINGGFFVFSNEIFDYLGSDTTGCILEKAPMEKLAADRQLAVYRHEGFWTAIDTYKELLAANADWNNNESPWKVW